MIEVNAPTTNATIVTATNHQPNRKPQREERTRQKSGVVKCRVKGDALTWANRKAQDPGEHNNVYQNVAKFLHKESVCSFRDITRYIFHRFKLLLNAAGSLQRKRWHTVSAAGPQKYVNAFYNLQESISTILMSAEAMYPINY